MQEILKNKNATLIDVRSQWEYETDHLPNALHMPLEEVAFHIPELKKIAGPIVLYCRSGNRSGMAVRLLKQAGITNTYNGGGLTDLKNLMLN